MNESRTGRDMVNIEEDVHEIYQRLTEGNDPVDVPFRTMKDVFMWAAALGYQRGKRRPLSGKRVGIFRWAQFSHQQDIPLLKAIAISDTGEVESLLNQDDILKIAEEYANEGIQQLRNGVLDESGQPLWNLTSILLYI